MRISVRSSIATAECIVMPELSDMIGVGKEGCVAAVVTVPPVCPASVSPVCAKGLSTPTTATMTNTTTSAMMILGDTFGSFLPEREPELVARSMLGRRSNLDLPDWPTELTVYGCALPPEP